MIIGLFPETSVAAFGESSQIRTNPVVPFYAPSFLTWATTMLIRMLKNLILDEDGPTAVEYAIMLALIVVICLSAIRSIGTDAAAVFDNAATAFDGPTGGGGGAGGGGAGGTP